MPHLRILHLEESESDCALIQQMLLQDGFECEIVRRDSHDSYLQDLQKKNFDLIFADCTMPNFDGFRALELAREHAPEIPFIFVSGTIGEDLAIESLRNAPPIMC